MYKIRFFIIWIFLISFQKNTLSQQLQPGLWKGNIHYDSVTVPFQFYLSIEGDTSVRLVNGPDEKVLQHVRIVKDSIFIPLGVFDAEIKAQFTATAMTGEWVKFYKDSRISFTAEYDLPRFNSPRASPQQLTEKWAMTFNPKFALDYKGVGLWQQNGHTVTGTVMTEVSDFRYFEGIIAGDSIKLSSFDGAHAFLIKGKKNNKGWSGEMHFDNGYKEDWTAIADPEASLPDPWQMVKVDPGTQRPFYDILAAGSGKNVIDESKYFDKVLIIQLFGTWCPNSLDETEFLIDWYNENKEKSVDILGVSFEANYSKTYGLKRLKEYKEGLNIPYDLLLGGQLSKGQAALAFPFMDKIRAFPTLVIVDKLGYVRYVHSYFNGPATGHYYEAFTNQFDRIIEELLAE